MSRKSILIIEDDPALRENTAELLELSDYKVRMAPNGRIGIDYVYKEKPDLIICDIMMPEVDGYGVLEAMNKNPDFIHIPFIFLSAKTEHNEIRKGMNLGADDYLTKPFTEKELLDAIESRLLKTETLLSAFQREVSQEEEEGEIRNLNELKSFFEEYGEKLELKKGEYIYETGDRSNNIYLVTKGVVKCFKIDSNGKELITELVSEDNFLGFTPLQNHSPYVESAMVVKNAEMYSISKSILRELLGKNQNISIELMNVITDNVYKVKEQLLQMAYSSVRRKTAQTLLHFADTVGSEEQQPSIRISRSDLASVAGIATESLIRMLSNFKKEALIDIDGREIIILNRERLESIE
ncbi:MAG TPA: response regulator [Flavobacteriaceae bacterium]|nr:response regulator [Flavobacteriaceae bacterium]